MEIAAELQAILELRFSVFVLGFMNLIFVQRDESKLVIDISVWKI